MSMIEENGECPEQCGGRLHYPKAENCSCHILPPCAACTDVRLTCESCGWREPLAPIQRSEAIATVFREEHAQAICATLNRRSI